ncbi:hypothetical protein SAICODRAFT_201481 [Saitoella complicata NRRL Y-17804]|uniref:uncharacterized protein n=1 Tax=Saitoella complicata (strain BCRC 22490 / CBS 7301 / JCM 7358 / NBRC 10748 / NRRL Y-17804) TaxID=698492 RepID=UPI000867223A|nr:uncharacterized protein SAICODRAFT_201481 [Saitoella complicata NRRL Y-17804]ODQ54618.1 hypothetical protein SAICODRAFT_201481 [Saitoella complicata NRRL Y-17804]
MHTWATKQIKVKKVLQTQFMKRLGVSSSLSHRFLQLLGLGVPSTSGLSRRRLLLLHLPIAVIMEDLVGCSLTRSGPRCGCIRHRAGTLCSRIATMVRGTFIRSTSSTLFAAVGCRSRWRSRRRSLLRTTRVLATTARSPLKVIMLGLRMSLRAGVHRMSAEQGILLHLHGRTHTHGDELSEQVIFAHTEPTSNIGEEEESSPQPSQGREIQEPIWVRVPSIHCVAVDLIQNREGFIETQPHIPGRGRYRFLEDETTSQRKMSGGPSAEAVTAGIALTTLEDLRGERFLVRNVFATIRRRATIRRESFHIARERWKILVGHQFPLASRTAPRAHAP